MRIAKELFCQAAVAITASLVTLYADKSWPKREEPRPVVFHQKRPGLNGTFEHVYYIWNARGDTFSIEARNRGLDNVSLYGQEVFEVNKQPAGWTFKSQLPDSLAIIAGTSSSINPITFTIGGKELRAFALDAHQQMDKWFDWVRIADELKMDRLRAITSRLEAKIHYFDLGTSGAPVVTRTIDIPPVNAEDYRDSSEDELLARVKGSPVSPLPPPRGIPKPKGGHTKPYDRTQGNTPRPER